MKINCYGEITDDASLAFRMAHTPLEIKRLGEWTFARYTEGESSAIHRFKVGEDGAVEEMWSYGKWAGAEKLVYVPLDQTLEVEKWVS